MGAPRNSEVQDRATVCMQLGTWAELTGLDPIKLTSQGVDGAAGTIYRGSDSFRLESNTAVRVHIDVDALSFGDNKLVTYADLDGIRQFFDTEANTPHNADHELTVSTQLGAISAQLAGSYQGLVTLTVMPQQGGEGGCGEVSLSFPGDSNANYAVIAFEDLYPNPGDADYNDFVVRYSVTEDYNATGGLETIEMDFTPIARGAGFNHALKLDLNGIIQNSRTATAVTDAPFAGDAQVKITYKNLMNDTEVIKYKGIDDDIVLFHNTLSSLDGYANVFPGADFTSPKFSTRVEITLANPELNQITEAHEIAMDKYRIFLDVMNTNSDIDLANVNPDNGMIDANGYPFGLLVPADWAWMLESRNIDEAYPHFEAYRAYLAGETDELSPEAEFWFDAPYTDTNSLIDLQALEVFLNE
jgi:LruC domain-containing protein